ncbi:nickel-dependent hydrogenase large subunit [candidate division KSB1 bacterium]
MKTVIPIGPFHPLQDEPANFLLTVEEEKVVDIEANMGYIHKGHELLAQNKTYDQIVVQTERICGICSISHTVCFCHAVENLLGIQVPERAAYIRTLLGELERLHSHLLWLGLAGHFLGYNTVFMWAWKYREPVLDIIEALTGNRQNASIMKAGGVRRDVNNEHFPWIIKEMDTLRGKLTMLLEAVVDDPVLHTRTKNVGVLSYADAVDWCVVGPTARASGVDSDIRRDEPYGAYDQIDWNVIVRKDGDVFAKAEVRLLEMIESVSIIEQCIKQFPKGEIIHTVKHIPVGEGIGRYEAPRGEDIHYVRSNGTNMPERWKVRAPSYVNVPSFHASCIGESISDVTITLASCDPCYSCTERMAVVVDPDSKKMVYDGNDLVRMGQEKTRAIAKELGRPPDLSLPFDA